MMGNEEAGCGFVCRMRVPKACTGDGWVLLLWIAG